MPEPSLVEEWVETEELWQSADFLRLQFEHHLHYTLAKDPYTATDDDRYRALARAVRDRLVDRWMETQQTHHKKKVKRVYYLSLEFLLGRLLGLSVINLKIEEICRDILDQFGVDWIALRNYEPDAGLGNGGLGRLAACFMESMSTMKIPAIGYGLRYDYGIFNQRIENGYQVEEPDYWLKYGYPWEIARPEYSYEVHFGGRVETVPGPDSLQWKWVDTRPVIGVPYDLPVVGYGGKAVNTLRLWSCHAAEEFHLEDFNRGSYVEAVAHKVQAENLTKVLYPNDNVFEGKELRLRQQYFLVSCSLQDIIRRFKADKEDWRVFPDRVFLQLNDTHPSLAVPELMRLLMDCNGLGWDQAWKITTACTGYTNHTILPEALEVWPVGMFEKLLPRHLQIIYEINARFLGAVANRYPADMERLRRMSIFEEQGGKQIRMAHLAVVGSCSVNGVSKIHTQLLKERVLRDFADFWPEKFNNKTNGVTPRRWLLKANPRLAGLITKVIGSGWVTDLGQLRRLEPLAKDKKFQEEFRAAKRANKVDLAGYIRARVGIDISPDSMFDVQVKRIHEYKRQLLLALYAIVRYNRLRDNPSQEHVPRTILIGGKAAPGFFMAKLIIKLIEQIGDVINNEPLMHDRLKVVFVPNYRVSLAERMIPAADLSEQISLAGTEASGTGNMKLQLNGALTIGTLDGANVEMMEEVGEENIFIFGMNADEVEERRHSYNPWVMYNSDEEIRRAVQLIEDDSFSRREPGIFHPIIRALLREGDHYMLLADLRAYIEAQERVDALYQDPSRWTEKAVLNVARAGKFSSDRTICEYVSDIWHVKPCDCLSAAELDARAEDR
ncbi:MAG TPA: glycogen/starch/alpha-glucan phosphorylase [Syntrophorhabdales bacterium]|nr:glycogen/starch/alpha-glucan phosphorylase [Syntrophorhabdales bacterium]